MELYKSTIFFNDGGGNEEHEFSTITFADDAIYMYKRNGTEYECGKYLSHINYIMMRSMDEKAGFPIRKKGQYRCKVTFNNKDEYQFDFIDFKTNTIYNNMDTLNDSNQLYLYPDAMNCIFIPFSNVYQFAYKRLENPEYTIVRNYDINKKGVNYHALLRKQLL